MNLHDLIRDAKAKEIALHKEKMRLLTEIEHQAAFHHNRAIDLLEENLMLKQLADPLHDGMPIADSLNEDFQ